MAMQFTPDPVTYETEVTDPGTVATGSAVGSGVLGLLGGLFGFLAAPATGGASLALASAGLGASIGAGVGGAAGTAIGTSVGTETKEFPVGAGPQGVALPATPGVNFNALGQVPWEDLFKEMDKGLDSGVVSPPGGELYAHTMFGAPASMPSPGHGFGVAPPAGFGVDLGYTAPPALPTSY